MTRITPIVDTLISLERDYTYCLKKRDEWNIKAKELLALLNEMKAKDGRK